MKNNEPTSEERRVLQKLPGQPSYEVGFGKPPSSTRFKPGQSGNPKGRPKGRKNRTPALNEQRLQSIILDEAYRTIKVNDGPRLVTVPMAQAIIRSLAVAAAKGNTRAQKIFAELLATTETSRRKLHNEWMDTAITYKVEWDKELERRKRLNINAPDPLPHPDDFIIDYRQDTVLVRGPMDKRELEELDLWIKRRNETEAELRMLDADRQDPEFAPYLAQLDDEIEHNRRILDIINTGLNRLASPECISRRLRQIDLTLPDYLLDRLTSS